MVRLLLSTAGSTYWEIALKKQQLLVREVDAALVSELKKRAVANGRSAEAEHRMILEAALRGTNRLSLAEALMKIPTGGTDGDFERHEENGAANVFN